MFHLYSNYSQHKMVVIHDNNLNICFKFFYNCFTLNFIFVLCEYKKICFNWGQSISVSLETEEPLTLRWNGTFAYPQLIKFTLSNCSVHWGGGNVIALYITTEWQLQILSVFEIIVSKFEGTGRQGGYPIWTPHQS